MGHDPRALRRKGDLVDVRDGVHLGRVAYKAAHDDNVTAAADEGAAAERAEDHAAAGRHDGPDDGAGTSLHVDAAGGGRTGADTARRGA